MKTIVKNSIRSLLLITLVIACFGLLPAAQAVVPAPDGGYPGNNTAEGTNALFNLTLGINNTAVGANALFHDTTGGYNAAFGSRALENNISGNFNMAVGTQALFNNTADANMAVGFRVLFNNTTGNNLTGIGTGALFNNTTGNNNVATGYQALLSNTVGSFNNAFGSGALDSNIDGIFNNAHGRGALQSNTSGSGNNAIGDLALSNNVTGSSNTAIGDLAGVSITGSGNVCIGAGIAGVAGESNTTRIKNIYQTLQPAVGIDPDFVTINSQGRLGRNNASSRRYKHDIKPMDKTSEVLFALKPVSFRYNKQYDPTQTIAFGLIAEGVNEVYPDLVGPNPEGQPESVRYEQINAMLLNEFLKEHRKVQGLEVAVAQQQRNFQAAIAQQQNNFQSKLAGQEKEIKALTASLKEQAAQIQKVSAQLKLDKTGPQIVLNDQ